MVGWWRVLEEYWRLSAHGCEDQAGWDSRQQQHNPSWAQKYTLPLPTLALPGPQSWGILWGPAVVPVATQVWSQCKQQVTWGQLGHRRKKKRCRKLPEEAGKQRREVSGGTWGGYETVCVRVSHIKVKRSGWCGQVKWICCIRRKGEIK